MINIAFAGSGLMASVHAESFSKIPGVTVHSVYSTDKKSAEELARKYEADCLPDKEKLFSAKIDAVCVCTPTDLHAEYALETIKNGKHLFLEKPLARTLAEGEAIVKNAADAQTVTVTGHVVRFFPEYRSAQEKVIGGAIGTPGTARFSRGGCDPAGADGWYKNYRKSGGVILDLSIHDIDYAIWCFGSVKNVFAKALNSRGEDAIDYALIILEHHSGVITHIEGSWLPWESFKTGFEIAGSKGIIDFSSVASSPVSIEKADVPSDRPEVEIPASPVDEYPYLTEAKHFIDCIRNKRKSQIITPEESLVTLQVSLAALKSSETGEAVTL